MTRPVPLVLAVLTATTLVAAEALRQAQLETMRAFPRPFAWAAFALTGLTP